MAELVSCSFVKGGEITRQDVTLATGAAPWRLRLRDAALSWARELDCDRFAIPRLCAPEQGEWLIYALGTGWHQLEFEQRVATRDGAEMWMVHRGQG